MMRVAVVDAGGANLGSVAYALQRLGIAPEITASARALRAADRVVLPGVSTAATVMRRLRALDLVETLRELRVPLLGVCVGMQLLFEHSEEDDTPCLGLLPGRVARLAEAPGVRVPHMGWNTLEPLSAAPLAEGIGAGERAYFVHSYAAPVTADCVLACTHGRRFAAAVQRGHVAGVQFHPERSAAVGARVLRNFLEMQA
ncbi:imidazole glycerol phosphate synthase subunit HisH [Luteimonas huabeiensis]|uniref:imidazole glycerol phosphate synthase subunit HisH n=1 Tax=Luteimonas huabeiensis TaxID=1244513 RepID=UPI0012691C45|nr:imidazole glycerol phosphate synthase subunit HisH [Luteimonas huabeiensis]